MLIICVKDTDGREVRVKPGGSSERQLIDGVHEHLKEVGVGFLKSEASVLQAVEDALQKSFLSLKSDILPG